MKQKPNHSLRFRKIGLFIVFVWFSANAQVKFPRVLTTIESYPLVPTLELPPTPSITNIVFGNSYQIQNPPQLTEDDRIRLQNQQLLQEIEYYKQIRVQQEREKQETSQITTLPSFGHMAGTQSYYNTFYAMNSFDPENYSLTHVVFLIENAFYDNNNDFQNLKDKILQTGELLKNKMEELDYDTESNTAKNLILFQYFSEDMKLGNENLKAFKYDFEDFSGINDYSKLFVSKLMDSGTGQCHSLPLLYLMLAEQIGAEANLAVSPNHSYIHFVDNNGHTLNIELTNGMFTTNTFILNSGFIKSEALQNKIYMQSLSKKELLSQMYVDLVSGYIHKYGYDEFVNQVIKKALELYPNNISAQMHKANYNNIKFEYAAFQLGIDPFDSESLQKIRSYPFAIDLLNQANGQSKKLQELGYEQMSHEDYIKWITSVKNEKYKNESQEIQKTLKVNTKKPTQKKTQKIKNDPKKKDAVEKIIFH